jgi:acyl carrier protein phosphodiesterase
MNWLAHLVLSERIPEFRVGNVLADILPIGELRVLPPAFQMGIVRHRAIDAFTDTHAIFKQSVGRLDPRYRRYGAVIMDVFYDHFLSESWHNWTPEPLDAFVAAFQRDIEISRREIPPGAYTILQRMVLNRWLTTNVSIDGVRQTLDRISKRLRRPFDLGAAASELVQHHDFLATDFAAFFPQIRSHFFDGVAMQTTVLNS